jgi:hypothetical protein
VIAIGELLLALKISVRETVPKNYQLCAIEKMLLQNYRLEIA